MPLEFIDATGTFRRFRLEQQTPEEQRQGSSCKGCAFEKKDCAEEVDDSCLIFGGRLVWKEISQG